MSIPVLYHGGLPHGTSLSDIDLFREATKQNGRHGGGGYAGFYLTESREVAERYNESSDDGGVFEVKVKSGAKVLDYGRDITRIKKDDLKDYAKDYDLMRGRNILGKIEYILLDKACVVSFNEIKNSEKKACVRLAKRLLLLARMLVE